MHRAPRWTIRLSEDTRRPRATSEGGQRGPLFRDRSEPFILKDVVNGAAINSTVDVAEDMDLFDGVVLIGDSADELFRFIGCRGSGQ